MTLFGVEAGYDYLFNPEEPNKLYAGVMIGYMKSGSVKTAQYSGNYGNGDGEAPSIGIYATLINESGWFVDFAGRNFWTKLDMTNYDSNGIPLEYSPARSVLAGSLEAGKDIKQEIRGGFIKITPKAELMYMRAGGDAANVTNGTGNLEFDAAKHIIGKAAILIGYTTINRANHGFLIEPLIEVAYSQDFSGKSEIRYGVNKLESDLSGGVFEGLVGLNAQLSKDVYVFGQLSYEKGSKIEGFGGNVGIKYAFGNAIFDPFYKKYK
jgi:outer membrane autotransporter protein